MTDASVSMTTSHVQAPAAPLPRQSPEFSVVEPGGATFLLERGLGFTPPRRVLDDPEVSARLGASARRVVQSRYGWEAPTVWC